MMQYVEGRGVTTPLGEEVHKNNNEIEKGRDES